MKSLKLLLVFIMVAGVNFSFAQNNGLAKSIGVYVFPNKDQSAETQNKDESDCYKWAMEQTNYDPMNPTVVTANTVDTSPDGAAVKGAARAKNKTGKIISTNSSEYFNHLLRRLLRCCR